MRAKTPLKWLLGSAAVLVASQANAVNSGEIVLKNAGSRHASIAEAIAAAQAGETIEVGSGAYRGAFGIGKSVTLSGVDTGNGPPVIDGGGNPVVITVSGPPVTISGFRITSTGAPKRPFSIFAGYAEEACVMFRSGGHKISNSRIEGCHFGVYLLRAHDVRIEGNDIAGAMWAGILIRNSRKAVVADNKVHDNAHAGITVATSEWLPGIERAYRNMPGYRNVDMSWLKMTPDIGTPAELASEDIEISRNDVRANGFGGIALGFARRVSILDNLVVGNGGAPAPPGAPAGSLALDGKVRGFGIGINCDAYDNVLRGNTVTDNRNIGLYFESTARNQVSRNVVVRSEYGGLIQGVYLNRFEDNAFRENAAFGIRLEPSPIVRMPSGANQLVGNDFAANGVNAYDSLAGGRPFDREWIRSAQVKRAPEPPADIVAGNRWDDGRRGNHFDDFDTPPEGFVDTDSNGIGEKGRLIPGGGAVDRFPLTEAALTIR